MRSCDQGPLLLLSRWNPKWPLCEERGGLGGISKGGCRLGLSCIISFPCLYFKTATGDHLIEVHVAVV